MICYGGGSYGFWEPPKCGNKPCPIWLRTKVIKIHICRRHAIANAQRHVLLYFKTHLKITILSFSSYLKNLLRPTTVVYEYLVNVNHSKRSVSNANKNRHNDIIFLVKFNYQFILISTCSVNMMFYDTACRIFVYFNTLILVSIQKRYFDTFYHFGVTFTI